MMAGAAAKCSLDSVLSTALERLAGTSRNANAGASCSFASVHSPTRNTQSLRSNPALKQLRTEQVAGRLHKGATLERRNVQCSAATLATSPPVEDGSGFCGEEGTVLQRPAVSGQSAEDKKYLIHTFGCQMNSADSERMAGVLETMGYSSTDDLRLADIVVYNTCSIRDKAEQKVRVFRARVSRNWAGILKSSLRFAFVVGHWWGRLVPSLQASLCKCCQTCFRAFGLPHRRWWPLLFLRRSRSTSKRDNWTQLAH